MKLIVFITLPLYALDQATKWWILSHYALVPHEENLARFPEMVKKTADFPLFRDVIPGWFQIVHWANTGAAFSIGSGNNGFFIGLSLVAFVGLLFAWARGLFPDALSRWGVALILSGILGNVTDRILHGYVVDFLLFWLRVPFANPWPAFNVADSCIFIAAGLFICAAIRDSLQERAKNKPDTV